MIWDNVERFDSSDTDVCKLVFTKEDAVAESVLYKYGSYQDRVVICCSVMSGCPMGCTFCGTGEFFIRNLTSDEIIAQVEAALDIVREEVETSEIKSFQIMTMSMGEPMLNLKQLEESFDYFYESYPNAALLVSTAAPSVNYEPFIDLSKRIPAVGLQLSVHESLQEERDKLIPFKAKLSLGDMSDLGMVWYRETGRKPYFNYCAHENNSSDEDIQRLVDRFSPEIFCCTISVICEKDETISDSTERQMGLINSFADRMVEMGYDTRTFNPAGTDDISGGCGMLHHTQKWVKDNPGIARDSCGKS